MNEFEQQLIDKVLEAVHDIEVKTLEQIGNIKVELAEESGSIKSSITSLGQKVDSDHKAVKELIENSIETDTKRLDKHSQELDDHAEKIAKLEEWRDEFKRQIANRMTFGNSIATIVAVIIAYILSKSL